MTLTMTKRDMMIQLYMKAKKKLKYAWLVVTGFLMEWLQTLPVYAGGTITSPDKVTMNGSANADDVFGKTAGVVLAMVKWAGVIMAIMGFVKLVIAINNDQADQIKGSVMMIMSGLVMFFLKDVLKGVGIVS